MSDRIHPALKTTGIDWENISRNLGKADLIEGEASVFAPNLHKMITFKYKSREDDWGYYFNPKTKIPEGSRS